MNTDFKTRLQQATTQEVPKLLEILESHKSQMPSHLIGNFNGLVSEFSDPPNGFRLADWKARLLVLMSSFKFEIIPDSTGTTTQNPTNPNPMNTETTSKTLYVIFADLKGYGSNAGNNPLLAKVTDFFFGLQDKYFADKTQYFFKPIGDGILATGYNLADMAEKALAIRNEIKNHAWKKEGFPDNLNVRVALHTGEAFVHYNSDASIREVSGTAVIQAARLEPYTMVGEVFCSQTYADLLAQDKTHNFATINLGKYNLGKTHDKFELDIAVLFAESDRKIYEKLLVGECKEHLTEKTTSQNVEQSEVAKGYDKGAEISSSNTNQNNTKMMDKKALKEEILALVESDIDTALEKLDDVFGNKNGTYNDLSKQYVNRPIGFDLTTYRSILKRFVKTNL